MTESETPISGGRPADRIPVILSTDVGNEIDDQWAIVWLLTDPAFNVRGILSAHAPSLPDPSAHATFRVLEDVVERRLGIVEHPPLLEGSSLPLASSRAPRQRFWSSSRAATRPSTRSLFS